MVLLALAADDADNRFVVGVIGIFICFLIAVNIAGKKKAESANSGIPDASTSFVEAILVAKESSRAQNPVGEDVSSSNHYSITCEEILSDKRWKLTVDAAAFADLAVGDTGRLARRQGAFYVFLADRLLEEPEPAVTAPPTTERTCSYCASLIPLSELRCPGCGAKNRAEAPRDLS